MAINAAGAFVLKGFLGDHCLNALEYFVVGVLWGPCGSFFAEGVAWPSMLWGLCVEAVAWRAVLEGWGGLVNGFAKALKWLLRCRGCLATNAVGGFCVKGLSGEQCSQAGEGSGVGFCEGFVAASMLKGLAGHQ